MSSDFPKTSGSAQAERLAGSGDSPAIILVKPQLGQNVGMAARAMGNFALPDLRLVAPRDGWPNPEAQSAAAGADGILNAARLFDDTATAIGDLNFVCATTARTRDTVKQVLSPASAAREMRERVSAGQTCGVLFGSEQSGLDNDDISLADVLVMAPVNPRFASLNLAQAVLIVAYEWYTCAAGQSLGRQTEFDGPAREGVQMHRTRPATRAEMVAFFEHLERELDAAGFLYPPEKRPQMVQNLRNLFQRTGASEQEIRTLRGVISSLTNASKAKQEVP